MLFQHEIYYSKCYSLFDVTGKNGQHVRNIIQILPFDGTDVSSELFLFKQQKYISFLEISQLLFFSF